LVISQAADNQCQSAMVTCVSNGGNCTATNAQCENGLYCNYNNQVGNNYEPICAPVVQMGGSCIQDMACKDHPLGVSFCWHGVCTAVTFTATEGQNCSEITQCTNKFYCNNSHVDQYSTGVCNPYQQKGQNCSDDASCDVGLACNYGICIASFSVSVGGNCNPHAFVAQRSMICAPGLICDMVNRNCTPGAVSSNKPCDLYNATATCSQKEYCACHIGNAEAQCTAFPTFTQAEANDVSSLQQCIVDSNCQANDPNCCNKQMCAYENLIFAGLNNPFICGDSDPYNCKKGLTMEVIVAIVVACVLAGIITAASIVFFYRMRKNRHYAIIQ